MVPADPDPARGVLQLWVRGAAEPVVRGGRLLQQPGPAGECPPVRLQILRKVGAVLSL